MVDYPDITDPQKLAHHVHTECGPVIREIPDVHTGDMEEVNEFLYGELTDELERLEAEYRDIAVSRDTVHRGYHDRHTQHSDHGVEDEPVTGDFTIFPGALLIQLSDSAPVPGEPLSDEWADAYIPEENGGPVYTKTGVTHFNTELTRPDRW